MRRAILLLTLTWPSAALAATPTNDMTVAHWWTDPYWWIQASAAVATMLAVVVALFGQTWRRKFFPPSLDLELVSSSGELTTVILQPPGGGQARSESARYYHLRVSNKRLWSTANDTTVYLTRIQLKDAAGTWYGAWAGEAPLYWRHGELYPLARRIGASSFDSDLLYLVKGKWLELTVVTRPNNLPSNGLPDVPGRWRQPINMILTVQAKATEGQSEPKRFEVSWDGQWHDGDTEIQRHLAIREAA